MIIKCESKKILIFSNYLVSFYSSKLNNSYISMIVLTNSFSSFVNEILPLFLFALFLDYHNQLEYMHLILGLLIYILVFQSFYQLVQFHIFSINQYPIYDPFQQQIVTIVPNNNFFISLFYLKLFTNLSSTLKRNFQKYLSYQQY